MVGDHEMVTLSNLMTSYDAIYLWVNTVACRFLKDVKNLKFVYTDSGPATVSEILAGHFMAKGVL